MPEHPKTFILRHDSVNLDLVQNVLSRRCTLSSLSEGQFNARSHFHHLQHLKSPEDISNNRTPSVKSADLGFNDFSQTMFIRGPGQVSSLSTPYSWKCEKFVISIVVFCSKSLKDKRMKNHFASRQKPDKKTLLWEIKST